jgi:hypothetical protein
LLTSSKGVHQKSILVVFCTNQKRMTKRQFISAKLLAPFTAKSFGENCFFPPVNLTVISRRLSDIQLSGYD